MDVSESHAISVDMMYRIVVITAVIHAQINQVGSSEIKRNKVEIHGGVVDVRQTGTTENDKLFQSNSSLARSGLSAIDNPNGF